ncbi:nucleotide-diphospho-sugar transferase [Lasiosphaeria ovina]|uniref:Nucleotide-diphospho-sugar transferase n=1 Tax=Lasiosphaeria ovina TaxID=92902 RepID=A0AAE0KMT4_9PEZI|nr:nucleotide-diphospho-sugar transferase [Lasiosphaeria ovina]
MITKMAKISSPIGSPTLAATTAQFRNRVPMQFRRGIPLYAGLLALIFLFYNLGLFDNGSSPPPHLRTYKRPPPSPGYVPPKARNEFPKKIWQTWKVNPLRFEERDLNTARSWVSKNPDYRYEVLTDGNDLTYVEFHYGPEGFNRPDIVDFYRSVSAPIVKADLLRYLIMYAEGGLYADIDVEALRPLSRFIPDRYNHNDIDMVIGIEIDEPDWRDHPILGPKSRSFCQWTFMCKPQLPVMMRLVEQIMMWLHDVAKEQKCGVSDVKLDFDQIISGTGPSAFTNAIIADMNERKTDNRGPINWDVFHDLTESKVVSRVLVLTVEALAAGQGHSDSGTHDARAALVRHHYHASNWPSRHPRYSHPAYGEVEKCNWNDECVRRWDKDVADYAKMPEPEQKRIVAEKEREKKEAEEKRKKEREDAERRRREDEERERKIKEDEHAKERAREEEAKVKEKQKAESEKAKGGNKKEESKPKI